MIPDGQNLFIIDLEYTVPFEQVEEHLEAHMAFIKARLEAGFLLVAGRKVPRSGGVILATAPSMESVKTVMAEDPFQKAGVANFTFTEFVAGTKHPAWP